MMRESLKNAVITLSARGFAGTRKPKLCDVMAVAPHLTREEAAALLQRDEQVTTFIGPPLLIRGAEYVYVIDRTGSDVRLTLRDAYRRKESFPHQLPPQDWNHVEYDYRERVANYAEFTYGDELYWDESTQAVAHHLRFPDGTFLIATAGYGRLWAEMQQLSVGRCPFLQILDEQLKVATTSAPVAAEICGNRQPMASNNCGLCGGAITQQVCQACEQDYPVNGHMLDWTVPLHLGLLEATGLSDYRFTHDPIEAIKAHYAKWAASGATRRDKPVRRDRVITFRDDT